MQFYTKQHKTYCGIDLHARTMYVCILNQDGEIMVHQNFKAHPEAFLKVIAPYRDDVVVAVEWTLHVGPGWPICVRRRAFPSSSGMPSP